MDVNAEVKKLEAAYNLAVQRRDEARKAVARVNREQQVIKWELEHQRRRNNDYEKQSDQLLTEIAAIKSHMPLIGKRSQLGSSQHTVIIKYRGFCFIPTHVKHNMRSFIEISN